jgi:hypothetical protein
VRAWPELKVAGWAQPRRTSKPTHVHEIEGVLDVVDLGVAEGDKEAIGDKLDVLAHERGVHSDEGDGEGLGEEFLLNLDGLLDDHLDGVGVRATLEVREHEAGEIGVKSFVARDELVGEGESGHEATLLEPEDGGEGSCSAGTVSSGFTRICMQDRSESKRTREEDALDSGESDEALSEDGAVVRDPLESPLGLLLDAGDCSRRSEVSNDDANAMSEGRRRVLVSMAWKSLVRSLGSRT